MPNDTDPPVQYLFIVARDHPEILARVQERLRGDPRTEVIVDRRFRERRTTSVPVVPERRRGDRRRPPKYSDNLSVYPTLVAQKRVESYAELQRKAAAAARECVDLRAENGRLRDEILSLQRRLEALAAAEAALRLDAAAVMSQTEAAIGALIERLRALAPKECRLSKEPRSPGV